MKSQETNNEDPLTPETDAAIPMGSSDSNDGDTKVDREQTEAEYPEEGEDDDAFKLWMAILIALVTLVGAWMGWVTAGISGVAGDSISGGMDAVINTESTLTLNSIELYKHYRAFTDYARYQATADLLTKEAAANSDSAPVRKSDADDFAAVQLPFFLSRYLTRDGAYNSRRELGEAWAETEQKMDLDPAPYFELADIYTSKTTQMMGFFVILSLSLLFYTLAEGLHTDRPFWRYSMALLGTLTLAWSIWGTYWIDR